MPDRADQFDFIMIKPSHYDDDGYPIVWWRTILPSNSLAALNGLARDAAEREVLGPDVRFNLVPIDECNQHVVPARIIKGIRRRGTKALIGLVGVQSNQFHHALDLAREFRAAGLPVVIGGFHVSGCLAMLKEIPPEIQEALDIGCSLFAGEAEEGRLDALFVDAWEGKLQPIYNYLKDLPSIAGVPVPWMPKESLDRNSGQWSSFDLGRGCPFQCSFCTIINVQGRKSRFRTADDLEGIIRENLAQGIKAFFITDDNLARNRHWEEFFDRLIKLNEEEGLKANLTIQVDTLCHRIPNFISKAKRAGVMRAFIGLENINPDNLLAANKRQNKITEYRHMLQQWHERGIFTLAGYILGFPADTKDSILRDIEIIKRELPVDILEFFFLTPLPGSEDHQRMHLAGEWMDPDLNKYDLHHRVSHHAKMSDAEWEETYKAAWAQYFTWEHMETVTRRHARLPGGRPKKALQYLNEFRMLYENEGVHTLEGGVVRRKRRKSRRPTLPIEPAWLFYPKFAWESARKAFNYWRGFRREKALLKRVLGDPSRHDYTDLATRPLGHNELEALDLFHETRGGEEAVAKQHRQDALIESVRAAHEQAA
ncbi:MAG TPA: radical SAM protein [Allosphingosinicella sp.]|nr:radical SAM protein [Allosphingosinicella sp.]